MIYYATYVTLLFIIILWNCVAWTLHKGQHRALKMSSDKTLFDPTSKTFPIGCCVVACDLEMRCWGYSYFDNRRVVYGPTFSGRGVRPVGYMVVHQDTTTIVMSSTHCGDDMFVSLDTCFIDTPSAQFHRGYYLRALGTIERIGSCTKNIVLVGHSMAEHWLGCCRICWL